MTMPVTRKTKGAGAGWAWVWGWVGGRVYVGESRRLSPRLA